MSDFDEDTQEIEFDADVGLSLDDEGDYILEQQELEEFAQDGYFENLEPDFDTDSWH